MLCFALPKTYAIELSHWNARTSKALNSFFKEHQSKPVVLINAEGILWPTNMLKRFITFLDTDEKIKLTLIKHASEPIPKGLVTAFEKKCETQDAQCVTWAATILGGLSSRTVFGWANKFWNTIPNKAYYAQMGRFIKTLQKEGYAIWVFSHLPKWVAEAGANLKYRIRPETVISTSPVVYRNKITKRLGYWAPVGLNKVFLVNRFIKKRPYMVLGHNYQDFFTLSMAKLVSIVISPPKNQTDPFNEPFISTAMTMGWHIQTFLSPQY